MRIRKRIELENIKVFRSETATETPMEAEETVIIRSLFLTAASSSVYGERHWMDSVRDNPPKSPMKTVKSIHLWEDGMKRK